MNVFFEESGDFKAGSVLSQQGEAHQVELPSGKRTKVRQKDVLFSFDTPAPVTLLEQATAIADGIDTDFLWEVAGQEEFGFAELGEEYFGHAPLPAESAGLLMRLHQSPVYFYRKGRGRYKPAPQESLQAALAGMEKKRQQLLQQATWVAQLARHELPAEWAGKTESLLFRPDKNSIEYKALATAASEQQTTQARLMLACGGIASAHQIHLQKFLSEHFPKGTGFPEVRLPELGNWPIASVTAFSIDDSTTTEIDDALSVTKLQDGNWQVGIHIAAPGLSVARGDAIDLMARARLSTVYMPGDKITMLPDEVVNVFTLAEGTARPALSLYATLNAADWSVLATETKIEQVPIAANLRNNVLNDLVTEAHLADGTGTYPFKEELAVLWQWAQVLEQGRMDKRAAFGLRPEQNNRVDYSFYVDEGIVSIEKRRRGAPLDKIVAEAMIFANSSWGKLMHESGIPGIYRAQGGGWGARMQVRMQIHAAPHQGLGVEQYAWSTSPLRRYTDLVNQWQIMACVQHGVTAPLVAPFKPRDADLFAIVSAFDAAYAAYNEFQNDMERYWCLRWIQQNDVRQAEAALLKPDLARLMDIPLVIRIAPLPDLARGTLLRLELLRQDEVDLSIEARVAEILQGGTHGGLTEDDQAFAADMEAEVLAAENGEAAAGPVAEPAEEPVTEPQSDSVPE